MSQPSLAQYIKGRPSLAKWITPVANWYANAAGYRKLGLRYGYSEMRHREDKVTMDGRN